MDYACSHHTTFNMRGNFIPNESRRLSCKLIEFKLNLKVQIWNWIQVSDSITHVPGGDTSSTYLITAVASVGESPKRDDIQKVVKCAIRNCDYQDDLHDHDIIDRAWEKVLSIFEEDETLTYACGVIKLHCTAEMHHDHLYVVETECMIPAASDLSLEKYEEEVDGDGGSCCMCLEHNTGDGCLRMPCSHVFHGHCIEEWLRTSHYCPLCRYQMPTQ